MNFLVGEAVLLPTMIIYWKFKYSLKWCQKRSLILKHFAIIGIACQIFNDSNWCFETLYASFRCKLQVVSDWYLACFELFPNWRTRQWHRNFTDRYPDAVSVLVALHRLRRPWTCPEALEKVFQLVCFPYLHGVIRRSWYLFIFDLK